MKSQCALAAILTIVGFGVMASSVSSAGKPGYPDKITWSGFTWDVKTSQSAVGPGPNIFEKANVAVDGIGNLHLRIARNAAGKWSCAEIIGPTTYGYGTYAFMLASRVDALDPNAVLGLFTWSDRAPYAHREIDIEFARWSNPADPTSGQYVVQPYDRPNHLHRFTQPSATSSLQRFTWQQDRIFWESFAANGAPIDAYTYTGTDVPKSGDERVHLNLWLFNGAAPTDSSPVEVVLTSFTFRP